MRKPVVESYAHIATVAVSSQTDNNGPCVDLCIGRSSSDGTDSRLSRGPSRIQIVTSIAPIHDPNYMERKFLPQRIVSPSFSRGMG